MRSRPLSYDVPCGRLFAEVTLVEALEALAVACFVLGHLVYGIVHGVEVLLLGQASQAHLVLAGTALGVHALVEVGLRVPNHLADQLGELRGVLGLLPGVTLVGLGDLGIALTVGLTAHGQVHAHLGALAHEVVLQTLPELLAGALAVTDLVNGDEIEVALLFDNFHELVFACLAERALLGSLGTFVNVPAYGTTPFLCHNLVMFNVLCG